MHAKKIRAVYAERMARLTELCRDRIPEAAIVEPRGGLHLTLKLPCEIPAAYVCGLANMHKIGIVPLEQFFAGGMKENGVVLGIGMCHDRHREQLVAKLAEFIRETARGSASRFAAE